MIASPPPSGSGYSLVVNYEADVVNMDGVSELLSAMKVGDCLWRRALAERQWERERLMLSG